MPKESPGNAVAMKTFRDRTLRLAAKTKMRSGDEIPKRTNVPISGGAVTSFVVGGPKPQTTTTTAITSNGSTGEAPRIGEVDPSSLISLTAKTVGVRVATEFNSKQFRKHHHKQAPLGVAV